MNLARAASFRPIKPRPPGSPKDVVSTLYDQVGGVPEVMLRFDIGKTQANAFTDPRAPEEISFARVMSLTGPTSPAAAEALALRAGGIFTPLPAHDPAPIVTLTAESVKQHGEAIAEALKASQSSRLTVTQRARLVKEIDEAIYALAALRGNFLIEGLD